MTEAEEVVVDTPMWRAVHVSYYAQDRDGLILDAVAPLLARLEGRVERAYFVRHWRRGPHLRLPVLAAPDTLRHLVEPAVEEILGGYLASHPSAGTLPPSDVLLRTHRQLAEMELERGPLTPLVPDNTIRYEEHDRRLHVLGGPMAADLLADFYHATNHLAFRMLEAVRSGTSREALSLALMLAVAQAMSPDAATSAPVSRGYVSFRSHAESFLHWCSDPEGVRAQFDGAYRANRRALTRLARRVVETVHGGDRAVAFVHEWDAALRPFQARAAALIESGHLSLTPPAPTGGSLSIEADGLSPLHREMYENEAFSRFLRLDPHFQCYRLMLNLTYLHLGRLGIGGYDRFRLCHLAANAVEDAFGVNALAAVRAFTRAHPNPALAVEP